MFHSLEKSVHSHSLPLSNPLQLYYPANNVNVFQYSEAHCSEHKHSSSPEDRTDAPPVVFAYYFSFIYKSMKLNKTAAHI